MRDFPMFTTENGVGSLVLKEIPYRRAAYITIRDSLSPDTFLAECVDFCRAVGAERIYACGHDFLEKYPLYTTVVQMTCSLFTLEETDACLFPVTEQTVGRWRSLMNERLRSVDNAATLTAFDEKKILQSGGAYYIHRSGELLGLGWMEDTKLLLVAAVKPGAGETVMHSLMSLVEGSDMTIEVASTNDRAIRLYEKLGFMKMREVVKWYKIV